MKRTELPRALAASQLRWICDPKSLGIRSSNDVTCCDDIFGQTRAMSALRLGLEFHAPGYNVFVAGLTGTGKTSAIERLLRDMHLPGGPPPDLCYVHDFRRPESPRALLLPAGRGRELRKDIQDLAAVLRRTLPSVYDSAAFKQAQERTSARFERRLRSIFQRVDRRARAAGFRIVQVQMGAAVHTELWPVHGGKAVSLPELESHAETKPAVARTLPALRRKHAGLAVHLDELLRHRRAVERDLRVALQQVVRDAGVQAARGLFIDLRERWRSEAKVVQFVAELAENLMEVLERLAAAQPGSQPSGESTDPLAALDVWGVHVVVDNAGVRRAPILVETAPTFRNLFGSIERSADAQGMWRTDHKHIRAGSILRANGGYLVLNLNDAAIEPAVWPTLKRVLKNMQADVPSYDPVTGGPGGSLKPEAVPLRLKVVVIGDGVAYHHLYEMDEEFRAVFKVKADFDATMPRTRTAIRDYVRLVATVAQRESLRPFDAAAVAAIVEVGARLGGRQTRLTTRFAEVADVVREAHYWAGKDQSRRVRPAHVVRAVAKRNERVGLIEAKLQEAFESGQILLDVRGKRIGQINALTVFDYGDHVFGRPTRITSQVSMGRTGIINIEREANLSGATHDKGILILSGYLRSLYAQDKPLTLSGSLAFEQSYGGVDGDSASAAEMYALLSAIANLPVRQDIAITGSIDQRGQMQPVGAINEKIEGFFDVCQARGLTGTQGVLIPIQNAGDLMLRADIVAAVRRRRFHVYPVRDLDAGIPLLFGIPAGKRRRAGWEAGSVHAQVDEALFDLVEGIKDFIDGTDTPTARGDAPQLSDDDGGEAAPTSVPRRPRESPSRARLVHRPRR